MDRKRKEKYSDYGYDACNHYRRSGMMQNNSVQVEDARLAVPDGGIASFVSDDDEMDDVEDYGSEGIAQFPALAQRMAAMGREGDTVVGHLEPGEIVIPRALIDRDPALREGLFQRLRDMGIEDPERYVVGSDSNSINPATGMPEFFLKKLFRGIKNAVKKVVKVVKKVATVVLPIALSFTPLGPVLGPAVGSGIATLINGGSFKDALKSAAISGLTAGVFQGFTGTEGSFGANVKAAITDPIGRFSQTVSGLGSTLTGGGFTGAGNLFTPYAAPGATAALNAPAAGAEGAVDAGAGATQPTISSSGVADAAVADVGIASGTPTGATTSALPGSTVARTAAGGDLVTTGQAAQAATGSGTFGSNIKDAFTPGGKSFTQAMGDAFFPKTTLNVGGQTLTNPTVSDVLTAGGINPLAATTAQQTAAATMIKDAAPSFLRTYGPLAAAGTALAAGSGMFTPVPAEPAGVVDRDAEGNVITGADLIAQNPGDYLAGDIGTRTLDPNTGEYVEKRVSSPGIYGNIYASMDGTGSYFAPNFVVPTTSPFELPAGYLARSNPGGPFARPYVTAAQGGAIFPRRNGGIMPDEGVPGKDSVRAMLMPGEFVMTTDAVRGAGNGNVQQGIRNMYSMMRNLETRGKAMA